MLDVILFQSFLTDTELRNVSALYNPMSLENLTDLFPQVSCYVLILFVYFSFCLQMKIDWVDYFNTIFDETFGAKDHHTFTEDDIVIVETVGYFRNLSRILEEHDEE